MNTWPTAPQAAKPNTSFHTPGCLAINPNAAANSPSPTPPTASAMPNHSPNGVCTNHGLSTKYSPLSAELIILLAHIICGPPYGLNSPTIQSCVLLVKPSNSRLIPSSNMPHAVCPLTTAPPPPWDFFLPECSVKMLTPTVTAATTRYLYNGYFLRKRVICRNMTGNSLQLLASV